MKVQRLLLKFPIFCSQSFPAELFKGTGSTSRHFSSSCSNKQTNKQTKKQTAIPKTAPMPIHIPIPICVSEHLYQHQVLDRLAYRCAVEFIEV